MVYFFKLDLNLVYTLREESPVFNYNKCLYLSLQLIYVILEFSFISFVSHAAN